ncbi:hypothetical protein CRUP_037169 [Coryphaenoides rupestris]|nr:hypothetical protein CRUP_037169 [Coryphaenoides rupestris]
MDFCSAMYESQAETGVMHQSIWYRSPEMMLGLPFTRAIDMWSLGCIAAELLTGCPMYPGNNEYEMRNPSGAPFSTAPKSGPVKRLEQSNHPKRDSEITPP